MDRLRYLDKSWIEKNFPVLVMDWIWWSMFLDSGTFVEVFLKIVVNDVHHLKLTVCWSKSAFNRIIAIFGLLVDEMVFIGSSAKRDCNNFTCDHMTDIYDIAWELHFILCTFLIFTIVISKYVVLEFP